MTIKEAMALLETFNLWSRGAEIQQPNMFEVGVAIEMVVRELRGYISLKIK